MEEATDIINEGISKIIVNESDLGLAGEEGNVTERFQATPQGMAVAYGSLVLMALLPIVLGSIRSVRHLNNQKESGEQVETMTGKDAMMFPLIASAALLGLYIFFQVFSKEYVNMLLTAYFFFLGVLAVAHLTTPITAMLLPAGFPNENYHLIFTQGKGDKKEEVINFEFDRKDVVCMLLCSLLGVWYLWEKHWIANNIFGLAFAINGVEFLQLNTVGTGCILLCGLFFYDIFWVFGTDVMVTVAKSFEAPIKVVFPQDLLEKGLLANNFAMLGLGDIVIPGIFIALLLRFDHSLNKRSRTYFGFSFAAYVMGLLLTIIVMHVFKHAQPALLYLVPMCLGVPLFVALVKGELKQMFKYEDNPTPEEETKDAIKDVSPPNATKSVKGKEKKKAK